MTITKLLSRSFKEVQKYLGPLECGLDFLLDVRLCTKKLNKK